METRGRVIHCTQGRPTRAAAAAALRNSNTTGLPAKLSNLDMRSYRSFKRPLFLQRTHRRGGGEKGRDTKAFCSLRVFYDKCKEVVNSTKKNNLKNRVECRAKVLIGTVGIIPRTCRFFDNQTLFNVPVRVTTDKNKTFREAFSPKIFFRQPAMQSALSDTLLRTFVHGALTLRTNTPRHRLHYTGARYSFRGHYTPSPPFPSLFSPKRVDHRINPEVVEYCYNRYLGYSPPPPRQSHPVVFLCE